APRLVRLLQQLTVEHRRGGRKNLREVQGTARQRNRNMKKGRGEWWSRTSRAKRCPLRAEACGSIAGGTVTERFTISPQYRTLSVAAPNFWPPFVPTASV